MLGDQLMEGGAEMWRPIIGAAIYASIFMNMDLRGHTCHAAFSFRDDQHCMQCLS